MPTDRTGKPWDSAQAIADEYVELQETQRFLEEQQATEDAQTANLMMKRKRKL